MQLYTIGVNHTTAPVAVRENVAFNLESLPAALNELTQHHVNEAAILSTCNRTELYVKTIRPDTVIDWLARYHQLHYDQVFPYTYTLSNEDAVKHAFRVASGLDSMVLGEPQILGQFKQSIKIAQDTGSLGTLLHKLFQRTFEVAKEVRCDTEIGSSSISMAAAAVKLAQRIFGDLQEQKVLFIGAGEMIELCADHFVAQKPASIAIANRTLARGQHLAQKIQAQQVDAKAILLSDLHHSFSQYDIVITCTASALPIVGLGMVESAIKIRKHRPIFIVDLAVPRDVEPEVAELDDAFLYTVDDLSQVVNDGMINRQNAAKNAERIVENRVDDFLQWHKTRAAVPTIKALRDQSDQLRQAELEKSLKQLQKGESPEKVLEQLSHALTNKFLHPPSHALNHAQGDAHEQIEQLIRELYQIKD